MKTRLAALAMILVGVGAVALAIVGPSFAGSPTSKYTTATATVGAVTATSVATGTVQASTVYGFKFGLAPDIVSSSATTSGTGGSTSGNNGSNNSSTLTWPVQTVSVKVGQSVKKGDTLAVANTSAATLQLASAQATLASAQSKLATDQGGADALTKAQAANQLAQSKNSYSQAVANKNLTYKQSAAKLASAKKAVTDAQNKLAGDPPGPGDPYDADAAALANAQSNYSSVSLQVAQSNQQAAQQVTNSKLSYQSAQLQYQGKVAPASSATIQADQATVASAQVAVDAAQSAVNYGTIVAPADGLIVAVNILSGVNAPSSYAIEESVTPMVATASFTETDITGIKLGQTASVTVTAPKVVVAGTVGQITPVASTSGGQSSVVTYTVIVTLTDPPATVLSGMTATVTVITNSVDNVVRIPVTALSGSSSAGYAVQVMNSDGSLTTRSVEVGLVTTSYAQITSGISEGETVVTGTVSNRTGTSSSGGGGLGGLTGGGLGGFSGPGR